MRVAETDHDALVQYFPSTGDIKVAEKLLWKNEPIEIPDAVEFKITANPDHLKRRMFAGGTEWAAMRSQYTHLRQLQPVSRSVSVGCGGGNRRQFVQSAREHVNAGRPQRCSSSGGRQGWRALKVQ